MSEGAHETAQDHEERIHALETALKEYGDRLHALEEKERARDRADHERELNLDRENAEGLSRT